MAYKKAPDAASGAFFLSRLRELRLRPTHEERKLFPATTVEMLTAHAMRVVPARAGEVSRKTRNRPDANVPGGFWHYKGTLHPSAIENTTITTTPITAAVTLKMPDIGVACFSTFPATP